MLTQLFLKTALEPLPEYKVGAVATMQEFQEKLRYGQEDARKRTDRLDQP
jgi:hypothetical protein